MNSLEDKILPREIDLFLWGHEHDCNTTFYSLKNGLNQYIYQPGSSIATGLSEGESKIKHYGILSFDGQLHNNIQLERAIPIRNQRGMMYQTIEYSDLLIKANLVQKITHE